MEENKSKEKRRKIIGWILNILLVVLLIVGAYLIITRILGNSPTDFQLILWLLGFFGTAMLKIFSLIYGVNREIGELKINIKNSFNKIRKDIEKFGNK